METICEIAKTVRQHYLQRFLIDYNENKQRLSQIKSNGNSGTPDNWSLVTDCEMGLYRKTLKYKDLTQGQPNQKPKLYRHDMVLIKDTKAVKPFMCWPVLIPDDEEFVTEDIPYFLPCFTTIKNTLIEINPFPWFVCNISFCPNAENVKGIIDLWFRNWFYPKRKADPFLNVVHRIDGPNRENDGGESYQFDFGTAPDEAFCDLINQCSRDGVTKIVIK